MPCNEIKRPVPFRLNIRQKMDQHQLQYRLQHAVSSMGSDWKEPSSPEASPNGDEMDASGIGGRHDFHRMGDVINLLLKSHLLDPRGDFEVIHF